MLEADNLTGRLKETSAHLNPEFEQMFDEALKQRVDRLAAKPEDLETLVEAITIYHMIIEGMLALTGQHFIIEYNTEVGTLPAFVEGFLNVARDEHRHVAFGAQLPARDGPAGHALRRGHPALHGRGPAAGRGRPAPEVDSRGHAAGHEIFGATLEETRAFAAKALERRLKVIGLAAAA